MREIQMIPIDRLEHHPRNPRKGMDQEKIQELAASIKENGVLQNLTVVPHLGEITGQPTGFYWVLIGNRRLAACELAGIQEVPCIVAEMTEEEQFSTMMIENMQRCDLTPIEEADGFQLMLDMGGTVSGISKRTGISETKIRSRVKMGQLPREEVLEGYERGATMRDYIQLDKIKDPAVQKKVLKVIGTEQFPRALSQAIKAQEEKEWREDVVAKMIAAGWAEQVPADSIDHGKFEHFEGIRFWQKQQAEEQLRRPIDAGHRKYIFFADVYGVSVYRERITGGESKPGGMAIYEKLREKYALQLDDIMDDMESRDQEFEDIRRDFIENFTRYDRYREEIMVMAADVMLAKIPAGDVPRYELDDMDHKELSAALSLPYDNKTHTTDRAAYHMRAMKDPLRVLLHTAYTAMESASSKVWHEMYEADLKARRPIYQENKKLVRLYNMLQNLGYKMTKEEEAYLSGSMLQFAEGAAVVDKFREEWEASRKEAEE